MPVLYILEQMGGNGEAGGVVDRVGEPMSGRLTEQDRLPVKSGEIRWQNYVRWARRDMKERGSLKEDSPFGLWEISRKGEAYLREHGGDLSGSKRTSHPRGAKLPSGSRGSGLEIPSNGLPVYARYKGRRYEAVLFPDCRVQYGDQEYRSPTTAGRIAAGAKSLNGWRFWRYLDDRGAERFISDLRD